MTNPDVAASWQRQCTELALDPTIGPEFRELLATAAFRALENARHARDGKAIKAAIEACVDDAIETEHAIRIHMAT